ncbi:hypothetical protein ABZ517_16460 [Streptomyces scabiei]|uniref:hypothetical protein n=1 Tax=Streptomyces scabiei TaxID=1930 RepID=UPI0033FD01FA
MGTVKLPPQPKPFLFGTTLPTTRLRRYRSWISKGWALDLNDAVRLNNQLNRLSRLAEYDRGRAMWGHRQDMKEYRRHIYHRRVILGTAEKCWFCSLPPTDIILAKSIGDGGEDVLSNKIPVCDTCRNERHSLRRDLLHRVRRNLIQGSRRGL